MADSSDEKRRAILIQQAFASLLSSKHLYQSLEIDFRKELAFLDDQIRAQVPEISKLSEENLQKRSRLIDEEIVQWEWESPVWIPCDPAVAIDPPTRPIDVMTLKVTAQEFRLPTVRTTCTCGETGPFNPVNSIVQSDKRVNEQAFLLTYECQSCKSQLTRFLVKRKGAKLTLSGRDPIETVAVPVFIPRKQANHLRSAIILRNANQTLAGLFLLRVFIEQFWRSLPAVITAIGEKARATGDELGAAYNATLPDDFKNRFPSLLTIYSKLSEAMHMASFNESLFEDSYGAIIEHFDARRLFQL